MRSPEFLILLLLGAVGIFFYSGCSSSSNSIRYNEKNKTKHAKKSTIRFSSAHEKNNNGKIETTNIDTVTMNDTAMDSDPDEIPDNEKSVDISSVLRKYSSNSSNKNIDADKSTLKEKMLMDIIKYLNTPYKWGGDSKKGIDCSAFTQKIFQDTFDFELERTAREQYHEGIPIHDIDDLKFGDLVFFNTRKWVRPGHVGIYIGDHLFAQSSRSHGVTVSSIEDSYYLHRFMGGRRIENLFNKNNTASKK